MLICRKDENFYVPIRRTIAEKIDIRSIVSATWKDIVYEVMRDFGQKCSLEDLYAFIGGSKKTESNPHWKDKIRQTLQLHPNLFKHEERGWWSVISPAA